MKLNPVSLIASAFCAICVYVAFVAPDQHKFATALAGAVFCWLMANTDALDDNRNQP